MIGKAKKDPKKRERKKNEKRLESAGKEGRVVGQGRIGAGSDPKLRVAFKDPAGWGKRERVCTSMHEAVFFSVLVFVPRSRLLTPRGRENEETTDRNGCGG